MRQGRLNLLGEEEIHNIFRRFGVDEQKEGYNVEVESGIIHVNIDKLYWRAKRFAKLLCCKFRQIGRGRKGVFAY